MGRFDHHIHTSRHSPDSEIDPAELVARARAIGLDGIVITEHDYQWAPDELGELQQSAGDLVVLAGAEISAREGHFLVYGLSSLKDTPPGISLKKLLRIVQHEGAAIVAAHPFRWDQDFDSIIEEHGPSFDALELVSNNIVPDTRRKTRSVIERHRLGATGSSDAHEVNVVGCYHTEFFAEVGSIRDFVAAIKSRDYRPRHLADSRVRLASGPVDGLP